MQSALLLLEVHIQATLQNPLPCSTHHCPCGKQQGDGTPEATMVRRVCKHQKGNLRIGTRMEKTAEALEVLRLLSSFGMGQQVEGGRQSSTHPTPMVGAGFQQMLSGKCGMKEGES